jgi:hypothetical protein
VGDEWASEIASNEHENLGGFDSIEVVTL